MKVDSWTTKRVLRGMVPGVLYSPDVLALRIGSTRLVADNHLRDALASGLVEKRLWRGENNSMRKAMYLLAGTEVKDDAVKVRCDGVSPFGRGDLVGYEAEIQRFRSLAEGIARREA